jgi:hypothetical protein
MDGAGALSGLEICQRPQARLQTAKRKSPKNGAQREKQAQEQQYYVDNGSTNMLVHRHGVARKCEDGKLNTCKLEFSPFLLCYLRVSLSHREKM